MKHTKQLLKTVLLVLSVTALLVMCFLPVGAQFVTPTPVNTWYSVTLTGTPADPFENRDGQFTIGDTGYDYLLLAVVVIRDDGFVYSSESYSLNVYSEDWQYNVTPYYTEGIIDIYGYYNPEYLEVTISTPENCSYFIVALDDSYSEDYIYSISLLESQAYYRIGQNDGQILGYYEGYNSGYNVGLTEFDKVPETVFSVVSAPFEVITNFLDFEVLGINLKQIIAFLVMAILVTFIVRKVKE